MERMLATEFSALDSGEKGSGSLMTSFVRALVVYGKDESEAKGMPVEEIYGNTFVINFAGHDTTAKTLAPATILLAANPEIQEWITEEVRRVTSAVSEEDEWDFRAFPSTAPMPRYHGKSLLLE